MFQAILAKIPALAPLVTLTLAAILFTLAAPAYADGHHDRDGPFWSTRTDTRTCISSHGSETMRTLWPTSRTRRIC